MQELITLVQELTTLVQVLTILVQELATLKRQGESPARAIIQDGAWWFLLTCKPSRVKGVVMPLWAVKIGECAAWQVKKKPQLRAAEVLKKRQLLIPVLSYNRPGGV
jgi:hypothetical protein